MSSNLYLLFESADGADATVPQFVRGLHISGFSFATAPLKEAIEVPDEGSMPVRCLFYAQNSFRIFISDLAMQFSRETALPPELATGERQLQNAVFALSQFTLRRWIITEEGWNDDDKEFLHILSEGSSCESLTAEVPIP